jgi:plasmid stabilization system protein ParE
VARKFRVDITEAAEADVAEIWGYIVQDNPNAATAFILLGEYKNDPLLLANNELRLMERRHGQNEMPINPWERRFNSFGY